MGSEATWRHFGEHDPYFGVLSHPEFRRDALNAESRTTFFESGAATLAHWLAETEAALGPVARGAALDFGCGVGRLSLPLAGRFASVAAVDVSPGMLRELEANRAAAGRTNITALASLDAVPSDSIDFAFSQLVLQHIERRRGYALIQEVFRTLRPGGVMCLEILIGTDRSAPVRAARALRHHFPPIQFAYNALRGRPTFDRPMQMNVYDANRIARDLFRAGAARVTLSRSDTVERYSGAMLMARKA
jgi:SAM-dependent methyltransferase